MLRKILTAQPGNHTASWLLGGSSGAPLSQRSRTPGCQATVHHVTMNRKWRGTTPHRPALFAFL